jgi:two-component system, OmpR family, phosphate regulon sensor histidine kinase PhoR
LKFISLHKQAFVTATFIVVLIATLLFSFFYFDLSTDIVSVILLLLLAFLIIYFIIKISVKQFIYRQLKKIYKSSLFENELSFKNKNLETDFESFLKGFQEFTDRKHKEIEKLTTRDDFRKEFLGDVSHELKTPLFTAQGYLLTLLEDSIDDKTIQKKYLERANKSIERLNFIVKDLDMISKLESGMKLNYESFNIVKIITDVFEILDIKAGKKNIALTFDSVHDFPLLVYGDSERIEQVLINMISNSISYGNNNGTTTVSITSHSKTKMIISVSDNGLGIEKKHIPRLFERFYRVDKSRSREQGGSGLGLAIVKHIIEAHNQEVFVKSIPNKGSSFSFTLDKVL